MATQYNTDYEISFQFILDFFALDTENPDTIADNLISQIFQTSAFQLIQKVTGAGSAVVLAGAEVTGSNYQYVYKMDVHTGSDPSFYHVVQADTPEAALTQIRSGAARTVGIFNMPIKVNYLHS